MALKTLESMPRADVTVYTDGSVLEPKRLLHGGGGYLLVDARGHRSRGQCTAGRICAGVGAGFFAHAAHTRAEGRNGRLELGEAGRGQEVRPRRRAQAASSPVGIREENA